MAIIDAVAGRGAERTLPPVQYQGGKSSARPDSGASAAASQDVVQVSDAARSLAARSQGADQAVELQLSPEQLRKLMAPPEQPAGGASPNGVES
jgi:hypothetical protein